MCAVRWTMEAVAIRLTECLSGVRGSIHANCFASPLSMVSVALSLAYTSIPCGIPATFHPAPFRDLDVNASVKDTRSLSIGIPLRRGKAAVFLGLMAIPMLASSSWRKGATSTVSAVTSFHHPDADVVQVGGRFDTPLLELPSGPASATTRATCRTTPVP